MRRNLRRFLITCLSPCLFVSWFGGGHVSVRAFDKVIDSPMYQDPDPPAARVTWSAIGAPELWLKALARPEAEYRCKAADAIAWARQHQVKGLEAAIAPLRKALIRPDQHPVVRQAVAHALIVLEVRPAAADLWHQAQAGSAELRRLVEPALARWNYQAARAEWLRRLGERATSSSDLVLAMEGLAQAGEAKAAEPFRALVLADRTAGPLRLTAAAALAQLRNSGLENDAQNLAADTSPRGLVRRLAAVALLHRHRSSAAIRLLQRLTRDPEATVASGAASRLMDIDPKLLLPSAKHLLASPDPSLRLWAVKVIPLEISAKPHHFADDPIDLLCNRLDDDHPRVRVQARQSLEKLAISKALKEQVVAKVMAVLEESDWRGMEQAAILLTQLDHKPAAGRTAARLVELLGFDRKRPEVFITAAWGLRKLEVPATLPAIRRYVESTQKKLRAAGGRSQLPIIMIDHQLAQLNQLLGRRRYQPADRVLQQFIPRMSEGRGAESRAAAIWALGLIHQGEGAKADARLIKLVEGRLNDEPPPRPPDPPENIRVRRMSAIALGRMQARQALESLKKYCPVQEPTEEPLHNACGWAIQHLTGTPMQPPPTITKKGPRDGFLMRYP